MRILVYGAGVQGCQLAHSLAQNKKNVVTLLARGEWKEVIDQKGLTIRHMLQRKTTVDRMQTTDVLAPEDVYDLVFVTVQAGQLADVLPILKANRSQYFIFVGNDPYAQEMLQAMQRPVDKIAFGFQNNAGRREHDRQVLRSGEMDQIKVSYTAGGSQALGIVSAQQRLLAAILREPRYLDLVQGQLTADRFIQPQQKELYQAMVDCRQQGVDISLATLRAFVSEEALNELSHLAAQYSDVNCTPDDIRLYLDRIARGMPVASKAASMTNEELSSYFQSMREKKQGLVCEEE